MKYKGETGNVWETSYAWYSYPSNFFKRKATPKDIFCAWCSKSQEQIGLENCEAHLANHVKEDKKK